MERQTALRYKKKMFSFSKTGFIIAIVFLLFPLVVPVFLSFNSEKSFRFASFSLRWYDELFQNSGDAARLWSSFWTSMEIALISASIATVIGTLSAIGVNWYKFRLRNYVQTMSFVPLVLPEIIVGISMAIFFVSVLSMKLGFATILIAHITFNIPFVFLLVMARLDEFDYSIIEAARDLGASEMQTLGRVILPISVPGIASGFLTAFTLSLEDYIITWFVRGTEVRTLPIVAMEQSARSDPMLVTALSAVLIMGTILITLFAKNILKYVAAK